MNNASRRNKNNNRIRFRCAKYAHRDEHKYIASAMGDDKWLVSGKPWSGAWSIESQ